MEKLSPLPRNYIVQNEVEQYIEHDLYLTTVRDPFTFKTINDQTRLRFKFTVVVEPIGDEEMAFVSKFSDQGLSFVAHQGIDIEKLKYVINEGYRRLPILLKHKDPDIAKLAWILSEYFAKRNDIMPEEIVE